MGLVFHALLLAAALAATALVLAPLRKDSPRLFAGALVAVPLLALALYRMVGTPTALDPDAVAEMASAQQPPSMEQAIADLEAALARDPAQPEGWRLLGRAQAAQGNHAAARDAFATALQYITDDAGLLVEAAQARARADAGNRFDDEAMDLLRQALAIDPDSQHAQWFIGVAQRQRGDAAAAVATWEALLPALDSGTATALRTQIAQARADAGLPPAPVPETGPAAPADAAAAAAGLRVRVSLDPELAARVRLRDDAVVFVIARAAGGPPMPVAVERRLARELPIDTVLDDGDSLMPTQKLSALDEIEVSARLSASGDATRAEGDLESAPVRVRMPADGAVELVIGGQ